MYTSNEICMLNNTALHSYLLAVQCVLLLSLVDAILKSNNEIKSTGKHSLLSGTAYYALQGGSKF